MSAIDNLLTRLDSIDRAVAAINDGDVTEAPIVDHLVRGIAINGLVSVEQFLKERTVEWASIITAARIPPANLPGGTAPYESRLIEVLPRRIQDIEYASTAQRSALLEEVGKSLTSLYSGILAPHPLAFMWTGSNLRAGDVEIMVALIVGCSHDKVWGRLTRIWQLVDKYFPGNTSLRSVLEQLAEFRHAAAHKESPAIPLPNLRATSRNAKLVCLCVDVAVSIGLRDLMRPVAPPKGGGQPSIPIRRIVKNGSKWSEYSPGRAQALKRHSSLTEAIQAAGERARRSGELVLALDSSDDIIDWRFQIT